MTNPISHRAQRVKPSPTMSIAARAKELQSQGKDLINLSVGEPDFDTPEHIKEAARVALDKGYTKYTAVDGIPELKKAIIHKFKSQNNLDYGMTEVMAAAGCKQAVYNTIQALINEGDEVLIPAPYWVSYPDMVLLAGGKSVFIETNYAQNFKITPEQLASVITPQTKLVILNSPSNPTGVRYSEAELILLGQVLVKHPNIYILSDDMYEHVIWGKKVFSNIVMACPELKSRVIICHGLAKSYAMTGWRLGFAAGPATIIQAMGAIQSQSTSNPNSIAQYAAVAALMGPQDCVKRMTEAYEKRHEIIYQGALGLSGVKVCPAEGTFYSFWDVTQIMKQKNYSDDISFSEALLMQAGVVVVPGSAFGVPNSLRLSYATDEKLLHEAVHRLQTFWEK